MRFLDEYRSAPLVERLLAEIRRTVTRPWLIMEICGGQTHAILRSGLDQLLPPGVELVHGPGCPVCVTALETIDRAHAIATQPGVIFCSFGDMLRVPGKRADLLTIRSRGADVRVVYSPLDALRIARENPRREVVFFAIGFETTAPANAMAVWRARRDHVRNFSALVSHVLVPPAIEAILAAPGNRVHGFLGPGHVCAVVGYRDYEQLAARHHVPIVVTGFEPVDLLEGTLLLLRQLETGAAGLRNPYSRIVQPDGNPAAMALVEAVFERCDRNWRGLGAIPGSGYRLRPAFHGHDAERRFPEAGSSSPEPSTCLSGLVLRGLKKPPDCPAFGTTCTPENPLGATMVSAEGACAAYFHCGRVATPPRVREDAA